MSLRYKYPTINTDTYRMNIGEEWEMEGEEGKERKVRRRGKDRRGGLERREELEIDGKGIEGRV